MPSTVLSALLMSTYWMLSTAILWAVLLPRPFIAGETRHREVKRKNLRQTDWPQSPGLNCCCDGDIDHFTDYLLLGIIVIHSDIHEHLLCTRRYLGPEFRDEGKKVPGLSHQHGIPFLLIPPWQVPGSELWIRKRSRVAPDLCRRYRMLDGGVEGG